MKAKFASSCPGCRGLIAPGAAIKRSSRGFMHLDCAVAERALSKNSAFIDAGLTASTPAPYHRKIHRV